MRRMHVPLAAMLLMSGLASCQTGEVIDGGPAVYENCEGAFASFTGEVTDVENEGNTDTLRETLDVCSSRQKWEENYSAHPSTPPSDDPQAAANAFETACQRPEFVDATLCAQTASDS